jgi:PTS system galactitol-specific IIB component
MEVRELLEKHGLDANITQCSFAELDSRVEMLSPDLILVTGPVKQYGDIPVIVAMPLLTGINKEALQNKIIDTIKSIQK